VTLAAAPVPVREAGALTRVVWDAGRPGCPQAHGNRRGRCGPSALPLWGQGPPSSLVGRAGGAHTHACRGRGTGGAGGRVFL